MSSLRHHVVPSDNPCAVNLVLLHGWGMNAQVWQILLPYLQADFKIMLIDGFTEDIADYLAVAPERAMWCGWSLGGLLALDIAIKFPERVQAVATIACNPCFVQREDWPHAMPMKDFQQFQQGLADNPPVTLKRFIALQCQGSTSQKQDTRFLQQQLATTSLPSTSLLQTGLALLAQDHRQQLAQLTLPICCLLGEKDVLVPATVGRDLTALNTRLQFSIIDEAAHAPFVSHPAVIAQHLKQFAQECL